MTISIGRAGRDTNLTLRSPRSWSVNGTEADLSGALTAISSTPVGRKPNLVEITSLP